MKNIEMRLFRCVSDESHFQMKLIKVNRNQSNFPKNINFSRNEHLLNIKRHKCLLADLCDEKCIGCFYIKTSEWKKRIRVTDRNWSFKEL